MRVLSRDEFLKQPPGTFYFVATEPWAFGSLRIKGRTVDNDWSYLEPGWVDSENTNQAMTRLDHMRRNDASYPCNINYVWDKSFDDTQLFLVFEINDIREMKYHVDFAMETANGTKSKEGVRDDVSCDHRR